MVRKLGLFKVFYCLILRASIAGRQYKSETYKRRRPHISGEGLLREMHRWEGLYGSYGWQTIPSKTPLSIASRTIRLATSSETALYCPVLKQRVGMANKAYGRISECGPADRTDGLPCITCTSDRFCAMAMVGEIIRLSLNEYLPHLCHNTVSDNLQQLHYAC